MKKSILYIFSLFVLFLTLGCSEKVPSDPIKGAEKYIKQMEQIASSQDYARADALTGEYLNAYSKSDLTKFFLAILGEFSNPEIKEKIGGFIANANLEENKNLLEFMRWYIATDTANKNGITYSRTGRENAALFCSILSDYAKKNDYEAAKKLMGDITNHYVREVGDTYVDFYDETESEAFEFCVTLRQYMTPEIFEFINSPNMQSKEYTKFQYMCVAGMQTSE